MHRGFGVDDEDSLRGIGARVRKDRLLRRVALARRLQRDRRRGWASMLRLMIIVLELAAGLVLAGALVTVAAILVALELGRLVTRDDEQREVAAVADDGPRCRAAA